jgi:DNA-binding LacI/PurR family transcriptional regulator
MTSPLPLPAHGIVDRAPARAWEDAFPLGNGRHGALAFGDPWHETVIITHHALIKPADSGDVEAPPLLAGRLREVRDLLLHGESAAALARFTAGWPERSPRSFHPAFAVRVSSRTRGEPPGYLRTLDFTTGLASAAWPGWRRFCFVSRAGDVVVQRIQAPPGTSLTISHDVRLPGAPPDLTVSCQVHRTGAGELVAVVRVTYPGGRGGYTGITRVITDPPDESSRPSPNGSIGTIQVSGARDVLLLTQITVPALPDAPETPDSWRPEPMKSGFHGVSAPYERLFCDHAARHREAYGAVHLDLGAAREDRALPVSELLERQARRPGVPEPALLEKLFDSGRYLLLAASGLLPPRLPGLWQGDWHAAWAGAITGNANLNLQLAGAVTNQVPAAIHALAGMIGRHLPDWRVNARRIFGVRGIAAPAHSDGGDGRNYHFAEDYPHHLWTAGADWLLVPLLDHVDATGDEEFLRSAVLPALTELALFYEDFLAGSADVSPSSERVIIVPSYSPENAPGGWSGAAVNATMDIAAARHALTAAADACERLGVEDGPGQGVQRWRRLAARLPGYRINGDGVLAEWAWPPASSGRPTLPDSYQHRHVSHLYPVWPLRDITVADTPELAAAARRALELRGAQDGSAHGYLHRALAAARLGDAELAGGFVAALTGGGFFYRSLMSSHYPRCQVYNADAACGLPGVLTQLLVDSAPPLRDRPGRIELLPAVPAFLAAGRLTGVRTLTRVLVTELRWDLRAGLATAALTSDTDQAVELSCAGSPARTMTLAAGQTVRVGLDYGLDNEVKRFDRGEDREKAVVVMPTLADVARHAGVAASTVSYVLSGKRSVSEETRRRVQRSIELLNYHPHAGARALASSRSNVLALFVPLRSDLYVPVMMEIAIGVTTTARRYGHDVLLLTSDEGPAGIKRVVSSARADAVILTDISMDDDRIPMLRDAGIDAVLIGVPADPEGLDCIDLDFTEAGRLCVQHLAELGHREVAFIGEAEAVYRRHVGFAERTLRGIRAGAAESGVDIVHRPCDGSYEATAGVLARVLEERPRTTGLVVQNEAVIPPLLSLLRTAGRTVPEDVSIVALCPDQIAEQTSPRLSSVNMPAQRLGSGAVEMLMRSRSVAAPKRSGTVVLIPPALTVRGSSAAGPATTATADTGDKNP